MLMVLVLTKVIRNRKTINFTKNKLKFYKGVI